MKKLLKCFLILYFLFTIQLYSYSNEEILIIFDASVSMLDDFKGTPKYITAVDEAKKVLNSIPASKKIGLRTIGITMDSTILSLFTNPSEFCKATKLVVPIGSNNIDYIKNSLDSIFPLGTTPLTFTLDMAINYDFTSKSSLKHIILITDGAESCNGDPCKYIRDIMNNRNDIKIDIIAIGVNSEDFKQLKCITDSTYGNIINIKNPSEFRTAFNKFLTLDFNELSNSELNKPKIKDIIYKNYVIQTYE